MKSKMSAYVLGALPIAILCLAGTLGSAVDFGEKYVFLQNSDPASGDEQMRLIVLTGKEDGVNREMEDCEAFTDKELVTEILRTSKDPQILKITDEEMENVLKDCSEISRRRRKRETPADPEVNAQKSGNEENIEFRSQFDDGPPNRLGTENPIQEGPAEDTTLPAEGYDSWPIIWPGTKWCGAGDIAKDYDDLGLHGDTDKCCRAHDRCDDLLNPGETRNNITNKSTFTKLSCKCDMAFYNCLDRVDSVISNSIGNLYFNVLKRECYVADYPDTTKCKKYKTFLKIKCKEYEKDTSAPKVYQWKSAKFYKKIPFPGPLTFTLPF